MATNVANLLTSIRAQIPDPVANVATDNGAFSLGTLLQWINDAAASLATRAPVVQDWYALQSQNGQMTYALPTQIITVEQLWYDLYPCARAAELDDLGTSKITSRSYFFGPHTVGQNPTLHLYPATNRTGQTTTLSADLVATATSTTVASVTTFNVYGYVTIESEIVKYETVTAATNTFSNLLRGQSGTTPALHTSGTTVTENNIFFKVSRLPQTITATTQTLEIPQGLVSLLELYVLASVREAEQEHDVSLKMSNEFDKQVDRLATAYAPRGQRQGLQVRAEPPGPLLYFGRVVVP